MRYLMKMKYKTTISINRDAKKRGNEIVKILAYLEI